ncbi:MAG: response regulator [Ignavibacteriaceae bacterium]|jgi:two-component system LytT family response regulator|nr:response regulator [Ignavibacteriaceae bacterium]
MKILIVDDSKEIRDRVLRLISTNTKFTKVLQAENLVQTKDMISTETPEVLLLDIQLPDGTAFDIIDSIDRSTYTPIILILTNHNLPSYRKEASEKGVSFFFDKSTEFLDLRYALENLKN